MVGEKYSKEELIEQLKKYRGILKSNMFDYLNSLIELEFSIVRDYITVKDREVLSELKIYNKIGKYNIYNRALKLLKNRGYIFEYKPLYNKLVVSAKGDDNRNIRLFQYYGNALGLGIIALFQTLEDEDKFKMRCIKKDLSELTSATNPYLEGSKVVGGIYDAWEVRRDKNIEFTRKMFAETSYVYNNLELSASDKEEIDLTNQVRSLLLEDYGLTEENFERGTGGERILIRKQPELKIISHAKYL